jgi:hypothetical protein
MKLPWSVMLAMKATVNMMTPTQKAGDLNVRIV